MRQQDQGDGSLTCRDVSLFHPGRHIWTEHFRWSKDRQAILGMTQIGRATIVSLDLNGERRMHARQLWSKTGWLL